MKTTEAALPADGPLRASTERPAQSALAGLSCRFWSIEAEHASAFRQRGWNARHFFPHQLRFLHRPGSDGYLLAERMYGVTDPAVHYELILHATGSQLDEFPAELFFDKDLVWHQQHFGLPGHVALANLAVVGKTLYATCRFSDIVQRIPLRRRFKTRIENVFHGWDHMLLNGIVYFAAARGCDTIIFPAADLARENTDRKRNPQPQMFERIYDLHLQPFMPKAVGRTWAVDVRGAMERVVAPIPGCEERDLSNTLCIGHDIERGLGHYDVAPEFAAAANQEAPRHLEMILEIEHKLGIRATYNVVGCLMEELRGGIEADGHGLGFHSFDHSDSLDQLYRCRTVDYRIPGYRPPRSQLTSELSDNHLATRNFEWLASSVRLPGFAQPALQNGIVKLPILTDDYPLHTRQYAYDEWERNLCERLQNANYAAIGLHDCYAAHWLPHFPELLGRLDGLGTLRRLNDVADALILASAE